MHRDGLKGGRDDMPLSTSYQVGQAAHGHVTETTIGEFCGMKTVPGTVQYFY